VISTADPTPEMFLRIRRAGIGMDSSVRPSSCCRGRPRFGRHSIKPHQRRRLRPRPRGRHGCSSEGTTERVSSIRQASADRHRRGIEQIHSSSLRAPARRARADQGHRRVEGQ